MYKCAMKVYKINQLNIYQTVSSMQKRARLGLFGLELGDSCWEIESLKIRTYSPLKLL